jgi:NAD(P)-dependent dehydrogenase (short-subunit alcohol dehydrogenase family)
MLTVDPKDFTLADDIAATVKGKRVLITGAGRDKGLGQAFALAAGLNGATHVGVHFYRSFENAMATVELINDNGGNAFPVQADVTNSSDVWALRSYVIRRMGGLPPNLVICNSGLSEKGYILGRPPRERESESAAMRRARARQTFVDNLRESRLVVETKILGFLNMTHLWAAEALYFSEPLTLVYISSRQAVDPGPGVPGYVLANFGVTALPRVLRTNLGRKADLVKAFSVAYPFVHTGMTDALVDNEKVWGRWQPRMLEGHEAADALMTLLARDNADLDNNVWQLDVAGTPDKIDMSWSEAPVNSIFGS